MKAIQINPNFADAYYCLAGILRSTSRIDEAKEVTQKFHQKSLNYEDRK